MITRLAALLSLLFIAIPAQAQDAQPLATMTPIAIGTSYSFRSEVLDAERTINVWLPASYAENPERLYPVLYVIDGGAEQDFHHISGLAQHGAISRTFDEMIVVGIETESRLLELTSPASDPRYPDYMEPNGGAADFRRFIRDEVIPRIAASYRVSGEAALIGESLAGLFVVETLLRAPDLFASYIAISPSLWWDQASLVADAAALMRQEGHQTGNRRLYLTMANEGGTMQAGLETLLVALESQAPESLRWTYVARQDSEHHGSIYHVAALDALRVLYGHAERTGSPSDAVWLFEGEVPPLSELAQRSIEGECNADTAIRTSLAAINRDPARWRGVCVSVKLGPDRPAAGNMTQAGTDEPVTP